MTACYHYIANTAVRWTSHRLVSNAFIISSRCIFTTILPIRQSNISTGKIISHGQDANWPTYVGEFSLAVTECQKYLNGGFHTPYVPPDVRIFYLRSYVTIIFVLMIYVLRWNPSPGQWICLRVLQQQLRQLSRRIRRLPQKLLHRTDRCVWVRR